MRRYQEGYVLSCLVFIFLFFISSGYLAVNASLDADAARSLIDPALIQPKRVVVIPATQTALEPVEIAPAAATEASLPQTQPSTPSQTPTVAATPYSLTYSGVESDLISLGYSLSSLRSQRIEVMGHAGRIPKRCSSGQSGTTSTQGLAIKTAYAYASCADGGQPLYDAYKPAGYSCVVIYNKSHSKRKAILAHELGHCLHFAYGQYKTFDIQYKQIRNVSSLSISQLNEVIADDFMICRHGLDTAWGSSSYYSRYGISRPTGTQCSAINTLINTYLIK